MTTVIGIDLGIRKIAWSVWHDDDCVYRAAMVYDPADRADELKQLTHISTGICSFHQPDYVVIEDVLIGNNRKYSLKLAETKGAVLSGVGMSRDQNKNKLISVLMVNVSTWKKQVTDNGRASKEDVQLWLEGHNPMYAELCEGDQDQFDATCIGYYGVQLSQRADKVLEEARRAH